jgi:LPXTG-motif cell wall-anchored protein
VSRPYEPDFFDKARSVAASLLFAAGITAALGSVLEWVTIEPPDIVPATENVDPYTGTEARDGWFTLAGGVVLMGCAALLVLKRRSTWAWIGFLTSIAIGAIAFADYRGVKELDSAIAERMGRVGEIAPALGLTLVAAAALVGLIASIIAVAASPRAPTSRVE